MIFQDESVNVEAQESVMSIFALISYDKVVQNYAIKIVGN